MKSAFFKLYLIWGIGTCLFFSTAALAGWKFPWPESSGSSSYYGPSGGRSTWGTYGGGK